MSEHLGGSIQHHHAQALHRNKVVSAAEAVELIADGNTIATSGFVGIGFAEEIAIALENRFLRASDPATQGHPVI